MATCQRNLERPFGEYLAFNGVPFIGAIALGWNIGRKRFGGARNCGFENPNDFGLA